MFSAFFGVLNGWVDHSRDGALINLLIKKINFVFSPVRGTSTFSYSVGTLCYYSSLYHVSLVLGWEWVQDILNILYKKSTCFYPKKYRHNDNQEISLSTTSKDVKVMKERGELETEEVSGYVICIHNSRWWLGCVLEKDLENVQVKLSLLHPSGPSWSFRYPCAPEIVTVPLFRVVLLVELRTTTGRTYTIPQKCKQSSLSYT